MNIPLSYQDAISSIILVRLHFVSNKFRVQFSFSRTCWGEFKAVSIIEKKTF